VVGSQSFWPRSTVPCALAFVDQQIGLLLAYDNEHDSDLTDQLERALDEPASHSIGRRPRANSRMA
jgi:hypothetical protein